MDCKVVFVTVGTTRFDKLISAVTSPNVLKILEKRGCEELIIQYGAGKEPSDIKTKLTIEKYKFKPNLSQDVSKANLVIAHAGAGTCLEVLAARKPLIVVANDTLMDSHQDELASKLNSLNYLCYTTPEKLAETISNLDVTKFDEYKAGDATVFASFIDKLVGVEH